MSSPVPSQHQLDLCSDLKAELEMRSIGILAYVHCGILGTVPLGKRYATQGSNLGTVPLGKRYATQGSNLEELANSMHHTAIEVAVPSFLTSYECISLEYYTSHYMTMTGVISDTLLQHVVFGSLTSCAKLLRLCGIACDHGHSRIIITDKVPSGYIYTAVLDHPLSALALRLNITYCDYHDGRLYAQWYLEQTGTLKVHNSGFIKLDTPYSVLDAVCGV